jgi:hypothetical protein
MLGDALLRGLALRADRNCLLLQGATIDKFQL